MGFAFGTISFLLAIVFGIIFAYLILKFSVHHIIVKDHKAAEEILESKKPPQKWRNKLFQDNEKNKKYCLKKLRKLINNFKETKLVENEQTRELLINKLEDIYHKWEEINWREIDQIDI